MIGLPAMAIWIQDASATDSAAATSLSASPQVVWSGLLSVSPTSWLVATGAAVGTGLALALALRILTRRFSVLASRTTTDIDDLMVRLLERTRKLFVLLVAVWVGSQVVSLPTALESVLRGLLVIGLFFQVGLWTTGIVNHLLDRYRKRQMAEDPTSATALGALAFLVRAGVWVIVALLVVDNLGFDVTALITGLGIGGIAIALAVQNVLGDLFASLAIVLDRPFVVGDFISVDGLNGTVEHVGVKTTRVRSISGEQLVFGNANLLSSSIRNYGRLQERRIAFTVGVEYGTPRAQLQKIPGWLREAVEGQERTRFDRAHFKAYGDSAIEFETVYYVLDPAYTVYMDIQQGINFFVHEKFEGAGIEFAFPSRTVYLRGLQPGPETLSSPRSARTDPGGYEGGSHE